VTDRRITPDPALVRTKRPGAVAVPVADLRDSPGGKRDRQLIHGEAVTAFHEADGWTYLQAEKDGYCGFLRSEALGPPMEATHRVSAAATHAYARADLKSPDLLSLSFGSRVAVTGEGEGFAETAAGYIPAQHLCPVEEVSDDPAAIAALFLGTPYLWGGNSRWGLDCSGLIQAALVACGQPCPGDSDLQVTLGEPAESGWRRNDLLFWKGHVAIVTDERTMIHANAGSMSTTLEPIEAAIARIARQGDGEVTAHRRIAAFA
jgi:cell wall-associated NlpC family hydrolase